MTVRCEEVKDELVTLLYEEEGQDATRGHLRECSSCQDAFESLKQVQNLFQKLPDREVPAHLTDRVFDRIAEIQEGKKPAIGWLKKLFLHPAYVAVFVFVFTLSGTLLFKRYFSGPNGSQVAVGDSRSSMGQNPFEEKKEGASVAPVAASYGMPNVRMVDWNPMPRLIPDLDRPVLRHTDLPSLDQASIEAVASFKHNMAYRHIMDGDYAQADKILDSITDNYLNYSQWEQAVLQHMQIMKKLGRQDEIKRDLARLREYAQVSPDALARLETMMQ
ncbi:MAG: hypothetical protein U1F57_08620 [bacterium]